MSEDKYMAAYLSACEKHHREMDKRGTWRYRITVLAANLWSKAWGSIVLIAATTGLTIGLCAQEVPDAIMRGLVAVESGATWKSAGEIDGKWKRGAIGEVSNFQLSPAVLTDLRLSASQRARVATSPIYAESIARLWLSRCYAKHGNWRDALSRYNAGSRWRSAKARAYSDRILSQKETY